MAIRFNFVLNDVDASNFVEFIRMEQRRIMDEGGMEKDPAKRKWYVGHAEYIDRIMEKIFTGQERMSDAPEHDCTKSGAPNPVAAKDKPVAKENKDAEEDVKMATFNLRQHLQKQANMAYEGGRGYFLAQTRAWMNCIKCNQEDKKSAQAAWQACFDEFQKGDGQLSWIQNHVGEAVASKVKKEAVVAYGDGVRKRVAEGKPISVAVTEALAEIDSGSK